MIPDVLVIGGGVIGLSLAWRLQRGGASVMLVDRGGFPGISDDLPLPDQASWAAAGILAPLAGMTEPGRLIDLGIDSLRRYPAFCQDLEADSGARVEVEGEGRLTLALDAADAEELKQRLAWQQQYGLSQQWVDGDDISRIEPALAPRPHGGVLCEDERHIQPRALLSVLAAAAASSGVAMLSGANVWEFAGENRRVSQAITPDGTITAGSFVLAGGASTRRAARELGFNVPVFPVKGQALHLVAGHGLARSISTSEGTLSPRGPAMLWAGATDEPTYNDPGVTVSGLQQLLAFATRLIPELTEASIADVWAGLRPGIPDGLPVIGSLPGWDNAYVASGHFRKGILLAPLTSDLLSGWILERRSDPLLEGLGPDRFSDGTHSPQ